MFKETRKHVYRLLIIFAVLLICFYVFYIFLLDTTLKREANLIAYTSHKTESNTINTLFNDLYDAYQDDLLDWDEKTYTTELNNAFPFNGYTIGTLNDLFTDETSTEMMFVIKKADVNQVIYKPFNQVMLDRGFSLNQHTVFIHSSGYIFYYSDASYIGQNYFTSNLYPIEYFNELDRLIGNYPSNYLDYYHGETIKVLSFSKLDYQMLYITVSNQANYMLVYQPLVWSYFTLSLFSLIAFVVFSSITIRRRYDEDQIYKKFTHEQKEQLLIVEVGGLGQIRTANPTFYSLFDKDKILRFITDVTKDKLNIKDVLKRQQSFFMNIELGNQTKNYRFVVVKKSRGYLLIGENTESVVGYEGKYRKLALSHRETFLPNELALKETLLEIDKQKKFSMICFAIEDYESIQNTIGRDYAKQFVMKIVDLFNKNMIKEDMTLFHIYHNQYVVLYKNVLNFDAVESWVKAFIEKMNASVLLSDLPVKIQLKAGIVHHQGKVINMTPDQVFEVMDLTIERVLKSSVYQQITYNEKFSEYITKNQQMELDLQKGITNDEFEMHLQPQYDIETDKTVGFELLLRWNNPKYIKESPATYVRLAEKSNIIIELGRIVTDKVFMIAKSFEKHQYEFSFNISPRQLIQPGFIQDLVELTKKYNVDPSKIAIELTETLLVVSLELIIEKFKALKQLGFKIHLDDFGTGYSSLSYLKTLPVDVIKIDKKFIDDIETSFTSRQILKTMTTLGKNLKLGVIFEGVETEKQIEIIKRDGGTIIQGFIIAKPMPLAEAEAFIKQKKVIKYAKESEKV